MNPLSFLFLLAAGCAAGFLAGFFGVGGGIILVPILLLFYHSTGVSSLVATHLSFGTSLLIVVFAALASAYEYGRNNQVIWRVVPPLGIAGGVSAAGTGLLAGILPGGTLRTFFAFVVLFSAFYLFAERRKPKDGREAPLPVLKLVIIGLFLGVVSSLAGVGGLFMIPVMYSLLKFPLKRSLGTSSATVVITAFAGAIGYAVSGIGAIGLPPYTLGYVDLLAALPLVIGSVPCARLGAMAGQKIRLDLLRSIFAIVLIVVGIKMLVG